MTAPGHLWIELVAPVAGTALLAALASWGMCGNGASAPTRLRAWANSFWGPESGRDTLFAAMSDPAVVRAADGRLVDANPAAAEILQAENATLEAACPRLAEALDCGDRTVTLPADGVERVYDVERSPVTGARWGAGTELVVLRDVTVRAGTERELQRETERLKSLASGVAHDLRNPLGLARLRLGLAREDHDSDHLAETAWALDRMSDLTEDLQAGAHDGGQATDLEPVEVSDLAAAAWRTVGSETATLVTATDRTVSADRQRVQRLLENLFRNALEHGGPDVTVTVGALPTGLYVEDDGPGIPAESQDDVLAAGYSTKPDGDGFGLHVVDRIAAAHGWRLRVDESTDGGARFEIRGVDAPAGTRSPSTA